MLIEADYDLDRDHGDTLSMVYRDHLIMATLLTRFGPNRPAADTEGNGEFYFWVIYEDFWRIFEFFGEIREYFGKILNLEKLPYF